MKILFGKPEFPDWAPFLSKFGDAKNIVPTTNQVVLPTSYKDILHVDQMRTVFSKKQNLVVCPTAKVVQAFQDDLKMHRLLNGYGYGHYLPKLLKPEEVVYPVVVKQTQRLHSGKGVFLCNDETQLKEAKRRCKGNSTTQPFYEGKEFCFHMLCLHGSVVNSFTYSTEGEGIKTHCNMDYNNEPSHEHLFKQLAKDLFLYGFYCVNYKLGPDGFPKIFEINPRIGGSLISKFDGNGFALCIEELQKWMWVS